jgi:iron complex transport system substrate-binding protein
MPRIKKSYIVMGIFVLLLSLMTACGSKNSSSSGDQSSDKKKATVHTMQDAKGKVSLPTNPKRIIAPYLEDSLVALGEKPVAQWSIGDTVQDYLQSDLSGVPKISWNLPLEQVMKYNPDLIIFSSPGAIQEGQYDQYKKIAPVYVMDDATYADWRKQLSTMGKLLGKESKAKSDIADYNSQAIADKAKIHKAIGEKTAAVIWVSGGKYYLFDQDRFSAKVLYKDLGIKAPELVTNLPTGNAQWNPISLEKLAGMKADYIFLVSKKGDAGLKALDASNVWKTIPAVKARHAYTFNDPSNWTVNGYIASKKTMDDVVSTLTKKIKRS